MNHHPHSPDPLAERVLNRITHDHVTPRPRWEFLVKNYVFWGLGAFAVVLGGFAFSATLFEIVNVDWRLRSATHTDFLSFFFAAAPIFWVITLALFIILGYSTVRSTNHGYRYPLWLISLGAVLMSLSLGTAMYASGLGRGIEEVLGDRPPFYRPILAVQHSWWTAPDQGLLGGEVTQVEPTIASFTLRDFSSTTWNVDTSDLRARDLIVVARGGTVRVVGVPTATSTIFHACFVFPWETRGGRTVGTPPRPLAAISSTTERNRTGARSDTCKGIRPYQQLHDIDEDGS